MKINQKFSIYDAKKMSTKVIGFLWLVSIMLLLFKPVMADMVNINKADAGALQANLEGIGPVKAKAIVNYRKKHGSFKSIDDLKKVPGVGKEIVRRNKKSLSTSRGVIKAADRKAENSNKKETGNTAKKAKNETDSKGKKSIKDNSKKAGKKLKKNIKMKQGESAKKGKADKGSKKNKANKELDKAKSKKAKKKKKLKKSKKGGKN